MIEIKPNLPPLSDAHPCDAEDPVAEGVVFLGMHVLVKGYCTTRQQAFYRTLPTGHTRTYPVTLLEDGQRYPDRPATEPWWVRPLVAAFRGQKTVATPIWKIKYRSYDTVIILNCLDDCYGHTLYKLFNAPRHLAETPDRGLVVLVPKSLRWLVPDGVAEVWWVDVPGRALNRRIDGLDAFVKEEMKRFERVYLSEATTVIDTSRVTIEQFVRTTPFPLSCFAELSPTFTFVCREDRFWLNTRWEYYLYLVAIKFKFLNLIRSYLVYRQNHLVCSTAARIRKSLRAARFIAVGIGTTGSLGTSIRDDRTRGEVSAATEQRWCQHYAASHVVIGVHGSGMLLPTSLSAGFVNLLPVHKVPHVGEDVVVHHRAVMLPFLGRFVDLPASPRRVARHVLGMYRGFLSHYHPEDDLQSSG